MAKIKDLAKIAKKYVDVASNAGPQYEDGVRNPRVDWEQATMAAEGAYQDGVTKAISQHRFGKGVKKAGTAKQQRGAIEKGVARYGAGITLAKGAFQDGFAPYHQVISNVTLPQRFAKRDPRNLQRVAVIAKALGDAKEASLRA
jgi:hypothetical protein